MVSVVKCLSFYIPNRIYRVAKNTSTTGNIKWDGAVLVVGKKTVTPMFEDLSGGISFNSTDKKETNDEKKLVELFVRLLRIQKAEGVETPCHHYVRYFGKYIILPFTF